MLVDLAEALSKLPAVVQLGIAMPAALLAVWFFFKGMRDKTTGAGAHDIAGHSFNSHFIAAIEVLERLASAAEVRPEIGEAIREVKKFLMDRMDNLEARVRKCETDIARLEGRRWPRS